MTPTTIWLTRITSALVLAIATFAAVPRAFALCGISNCSITCSTDAVLANDINCSGGSGIILASGADLDMSGYNITCTSNCPAKAITMTANASIVKNAGGSESKIAGAFGTNLVDCALKSSSRVTGIRLESTVANTALKDCAKVDGNVLIGPGINGSYGVQTAGIANTDYITDNYVDQWHTGIRVSGSKDVLVDGNVVSVRDVSGGSSEVGIIVESGTTGAVTVSNSTLFGDPPLGELMSLNGPYNPFTNFCDPVSAACATCQSSGYCTIPTAPIVRP